MFYKFFIALSRVCEFREDIVTLLSCSRWNDHLPWPCDKLMKCLVSRIHFRNKFRLNHHLPPLTTTLQSYAARTDPTLQNVTPQWKDAVGRSTLISSLILDEKPGFLSQLFEQTYPSYNPGGQPEMSPEVVAATEEVKRAAQDA